MMGYSLRVPDILNDDIEWATLPDNGGQTRAQVHAAFIGGAATKTQLKPGFELCKMNGYATLAQNSEKTTVVSAWWTNLDRWQDVVGFEDRVKMAKVFKVTVRELCRAFLAVRENWNGFEYLACVALAKPVWAFVGGVSQQIRIESKPDGTKLPSQLRPGERRSGSVHLPGRAIQIYIPFLTLGHLRMIRMHRLSEIERGAVQQY
jgi:hypothetical protein